MMDSIVCGTLHTVESAAKYGIHHGYGHCKRSSRRSPDTLVNNPREHQWVTVPGTRAARAVVGAAGGMGELRPQPRAAWATAEPTGRTPSSDGAHDEEGGFRICARLDLA